MKKKTQDVRVELTKEDGVYTVSPIDRCGSPTVGRGDTPLEALLFFVCQYDHFNIKFIDKTGEVLDENGVFPNGFNSRCQPR
jgi:hypothetical protein